MRVGRAGSWFLLPLVLASLSAIVELLVGCEDAPAAREARDGGGVRKDAGEDDPDDPDDDPEADAAPAPGCDLDADLSREIKDASIADGQSTTGFCVRCVRSSCDDELGACNASCPCKEAAPGALECFARDAGDLRCATALKGEAESLGRALLSCSRTKCAEACQVNPFVDGG